MKRRLANKIVSFILMITMLMGSLPLETMAEAGQAVYGLAVMSQGQYSHTFSGTGDSATLEEILEENGITLKENFKKNVSVDTSLVRMEEVKGKIQDNRVQNYRFTARDYFENTQLVLNGKKGTRLAINLSNPEQNIPESGNDPDGEDDEEGLLEGALYYNDDFYLTGHIPGNGIVDVQPVEISSPDGRDVIRAWDIRIYANEKQREKGKTWQPAAKKVKVHWRDKNFSSARNLSVYHYENGTPQLAAENVTVQDGWIEFEAESFSVYAVTGIIEKDIEIDGDTYRVSLTYGSDAGIPEGAALEVQAVEKPEDYFEFRENDIVLYTKVLDISILAPDGNGNMVEIEPNPGSSVVVSVKLLDAVEGTDIDVVHLVPNRMLMASVNADGSSYSRIPMESSTNGNEVTFTTDSFSFFGFSSVAREILSWTDDLLSGTILGRSSKDTAEYGEMKVEGLVRGLELLDAYTVTMSQNLWLSIQRVADLALGKLESIDLYSVVDGKLDQLVRENVSLSDVLQLSLGNLGAFALVKDTGLRDRVLEAKKVIVSGFVPKDATLEMSEVASKAVLAENEEALASYDISIVNDGEEYKPSEAVEVTLECPEAATALAAGYGIEVWHVKDDGTTEKVDYQLSDGMIRFSAESFSEYTVVKTVLEKTISTPDGLDYKITVSYDSDSGLPEGVDLDVKVLENPDAYLETAKTALNTEKTSIIKAFDISIVDEEGKHWQPTKDVLVTIELTGTELNTPRIVHIPDEGEAEGIVPSVSGELLSFQSNSFSVYVVAQVVLEDTISASDGNTYKITVSYDSESGLPTEKEGAHLSVAEILSEEELAGVAAAIDSKRAENRKVALSRTFDIKILDKDENEVQPNEGANVQVTFELVQVGNTNLTTEVYHIKQKGEALTAESLTVTNEEGNTATVDTTGFSYFTVEFTYDGKEYVLPGDDLVRLDEVLTAIGITGEIEDAEVSNNALFEAHNSWDGYWYVYALNPFDTTEWMKVTVDGVVYEIVVTDDLIGVEASGSAAAAKFASGMDIATITIQDLGKLEGMVELASDVTKKSSGKIYWSGTLAQGGTKTLSGDQVKVKYIKAATTADGASCDVEIVISDVVIYGDKRNEGTGNFVFATLCPKSNGNTYPLAITAYPDGTWSGYREGVKAKITVNVYKTGTTIPADGTFAFTIFDLNQNKSNTSWENITDAENHYTFSEYVTVDGSAYNVYYNTARMTKTGSDIYPQSGNGGGHSYETGIAFLARSGASLIGYNGGGTDVGETSFYIMPRAGINHPITSYSSLGGSIVTDTHGNGTGTVLPGGVVGDPRVYVIPAGKSVSYRMTPNAGYVLKGIYIDGNLITDAEYTANSDGSYTYTFPAVGDTHKINVRWQMENDLQLTLGHLGMQSDSNGGVTHVNLDDQVYSANPSHPRTTALDKNGAANKMGDLVTQPGYGAPAIDGYTFFTYALGYAGEGIPSQFYAKSDDLALRINEENEVQYCVNYTGDASTSTWETWSVKDSEGNPTVPKIYAVYTAQWAEAFALTVTKTWTDSTAAAGADQSNGNNSITLTFREEDGDALIATDFIGITQTDPNVTVGTDGKVTLSKSTEDDGQGGTTQVWPASWTVMVPATAKGVTEHVNGYVDDVKANFSDTAAPIGGVNVAAYTVRITNTRAIVKITDNSGNLLYKADGTPAVYTTATALEDSFGEINNVNIAFYTTAIGSAGLPYEGTDYQVQMLVENYAMTGGTNLERGKTVTLTTASERASDGFPYTGAAGTKSTITRASSFASASMITNKGALTLTNITLDGNNVETATSVAGGIVNCDGMSNGSGISLTVTTGATLQNSRANRRYMYYGGGGAIYALRTALTINGGTFINNHSGSSYDQSGSGDYVCHGGAIYVSQLTELTVTGATFIGNTSLNSGGAIYIDNSYSKSVSIENCTFSNNKAYVDGGAICNNASKLTVTNSTFTENKTTTGNGGAVYSRFLPNDPNEISGSTFTKNEAALDGGAMYIYPTGGALSAITNCEISENKAGRNGGGILKTGYGSLAITGGTISQNNAIKDGGAICYDRDHRGHVNISTITNCAITGNESTGNGGAIYFTADSDSTYSGLSIRGGRITGNTAEGNGGAIYYNRDMTQLQITNTPIGGASPGDGNSAANGGAIYINADRSSTIGATITGNTATGDGGAIYIASGSSGTTTIGGTITGNTAGGHGGAIYTNGFALQVGGTITENSANGNGGAIFANSAYTSSASGTTIKNNAKIQNNRAGMNGGAVYLAGNKLNIGGTNTEITGNVATLNGGAVYISGGTTTISGGAITGNSGADGGVSGVEGYKVNFAGTPTIYDNHSATEGEAQRNVLITGASNIRVINRLEQGAKIGVYPANENCDNGGEQFGVYDSSGYTRYNANLNAFWNDIVKNPLGEPLRGSDGGDPRIVWQIFVARVSNDDGENWTYHECLIDNSPDTQGGKNIKRGAFDYANTLSGDVIVETLFETHDRYTLSSGFWFNNSSITALTIHPSDQVKDASGNQLKSKLIKNRRNASMITFAFTGNTSIMVENMEFDGQNMSANSGGALYQSNADCTVQVTLKGIVVRNFNATGSGTSGGGGVAVLSKNGKLTIEDSIFTDCWANRFGGAVFTNTQKTEISDCIFDGHNTLGDSQKNALYGGAVYQYGYSTPVSLKIERTNFCNCSVSDYGGAVYARAKTAEIENCIFNGHSGSTFTEPNATLGGAIFFIQDGTDNLALKLNNTSISECSATNTGAAVYSNGNLAIKGTSVIQNCSASADNGGAVNVASGKTMTFEGNVVIYDNKGTGTLASQQKNVVLDQDNNTTINTASTGLGSSAKIGVYVTGTNPTTNTNDQFYKHGREGAPFGTYGKGVDGSYEGDYHYFINDRLSTPASATAAEKLVRGTAKKATDTTNIMYWEKGDVTLTIDKTVTGAMGDHTKGFSFTLTGLENSATGAFTKYEWDASQNKYVPMSGAEDSGDWTATAIPASSSTYGITFTLKHNQRIELEGLPADTTLTLIEGNGYYTATVEEIPEGETTKLAHPTAASGKAPVVATTTGETGSTTATFKMMADAELQVTNNLEAISPTGVNLTWVPYLLTLVFGGLLLMLALKRREKN